MNSRMQINDTLKIRIARAKDIGDLKQILEEWIRDSHTGEIQVAEIGQVLENITAASKGENGRRYLVAQSGGVIVGMVGIAEPEDWMMRYAKTDHPAEMVSAFVMGSKRGMGVGTRLICAIEELALETGHTELIIKSGPRYEHTAWTLYDKLFERIASARDYWGPGAEAPIWRKLLGPTRVR